MNNLPTRALKGAEHALAPEVNQDRWWQSVLARDAQADGQFYYAVKTTGIYCKPSCGARQARRENVSFHPSKEAAEAAGFRPCKRCKPDQITLAEVYSTKVEQICRIIERSSTVPTLKELATHAGMSSYHFHRVFKAETGLTPKAYASANKAKAIREKLHEQGSVTDAIYASGYASNSRFYETSMQTLGMTPTRYRNGGAGTDIKFAVGACSMGAILIAASEKGVCAILMGDDPDALVKNLQDRFPRSNLLGGDHDFELLVATVVGFIEAPKLGLNLPLDIRGTAFQQRVWQALREIPHGATATYTEIANRINMPSAVRAVAQACGANALAVAIPCHRVIRQDGSLSGYRWGIERKRALLKKEAGVDTDIDTSEDA